MDIASGTYNSTLVVDNRFEPLYQPANQGTAGHLITFKTTGTVNLTSTTTLSPMIGGQNRDYIRWLGHFVIDQDTHLAHADTGPVTWIGCTGGVIDGAELIGIPAFSWGDNHNGVRMEGSTACTVRNLTLQDWFDGGGANGTFVTLYNCHDCIVEHCRGDGAGVAVYFKDQGLTQGQEGNIVRYNHFTNTLNSFFRWSHVTAPADEDRSTVHDNLCIGGHAGANIIDAINDVINNNTFVGLNVGLIVGGTGIRAMNNIFKDVAKGIEVESAPMPAASVYLSNRNVWHGHSPFYEGSDGTRTFSSYRTAFTDQDVNSVEADPLFVNQGTGNYALQGGSPAIGLGRHPDTSAVVDAGCDFSQVGLEP